MADQGKIVNTVHQINKGYLLKRQNKYAIKLVFQFFLFFNLAPKPLKYKRQRIA